MFTGLIAEKGTVVEASANARGLRIAVRTPGLSGEVKIGDSVSVNGVCLTAVRIAPPVLEFDAVTETAERTALDRLRVGESVNLEPALRVGDRLGGHMVLGHVDGLGRLRKIEKIGSETRLSFTAPPEIMQYIVPKGSIAVDGVSLTIADCGSEGFSVAVIPHTLSSTTLGEKNSGSFVNLETDIIGKYVFQYVGKAAQSTDQSLLEKLSEGGFLD
jgi:riboflavin synthase